MTFLSLSLYNCPNDEVLDLYNTSLTGIPYEDFMMACKESEIEALKAEGMRQIEERGYVASYDAEQCELLPWSLLPMRKNARCFGRSILELKKAASPSGETAFCRFDIMFLGGFKDCPASHP